MPDHDRGSCIGQRQEVREADGPAGDDGDVQEAVHARRAPQATRELGR